ncbi:DUF1348-domain-containing protein [Pyronema domesticum]|uniref:DUF1348-domain-containing protein n=1 Tax=Pyronema omphalodes (strain CBS 100304) TaxID=1076935 RepID=U4L3Z6_PYROM|nr:DUF1348-domain-containing protein [Pyronema domesticum]CCX10454.1 Similar to predicted protein [Laccaria bicolor S238N-H82]; acc. no. XP_001877237 [Pyronema omphalodes CBS 100304]
MSHIFPPFTAETAKAKVKAAQNLWNTKDPARVALAYTPGSIWRNRDSFLKGHDEIISFLSKKWEKENGYRLRKELFAFTDNKIAVQFWYEFYVDSEGDNEDKKGRKWFRCYGLEDWTFCEDGRMEKRQMSGNDVEITEEERWFKEGVDVDSVEIGAEHW